MKVQNKKMASSALAENTKKQKPRTQNNRSLTDYSMDLSGEMSKFGENGRLSNICKRNT